MSNEYTGKIIKIYETLTFPSGFQKRDLVLSNPDDRYPQEVPFSFMKDNCSKLDDLNLGDTVTVRFDLQGREHGGRHYPENSAWRVDMVTRAGMGHIADQNASQGHTDPSADVYDNGEDVPF